MTFTDPRGPRLSPFVRGAKDPAVFFLQGNLARPIPDAATLAFMLGRDTVRSLTDAALAAIPRGQALPSRENGAILTELTPGIPIGPTAFLMQGGAKRRAPDPATAAAILAMGRGAHVATPADLAAIPDGPALPSRADGVAYPASGIGFAYVMKGGRRSAAPDATTVRDAGSNPLALQPISATDLAVIPEGAPLPSTSKFRRPPPTGTPLLLLPVRLEARFQGQELWLRIYPDTVHVNSFEPELTPDESAARAAYRGAAQADPPSATAAFAALARRFGPKRAAWIASDAAGAGAKPASWTRAPHADALPERWIVIGYQTDGPGQVLFVGGPIADSLAVGPAPQGDGPSADSGFAWIFDFDKAITAGMACRIPLTGGQTRGFKRLLVLGLKSELDPAEAARRVGALLQAHHYTDGLELLPHGAATNNTEDTASALSSRDPNFEALFEREQGAPAVLTGADGERLAQALGFDPGLLAHVDGAAGGQDADAAAMNTVLWPATWGYYLEQMVGGAIASAETRLPLTRDHFVRHVRGRGHFPILRVGTQPYGVLPVMRSAGWKPLQGSPLEAPLMGLLGRMRATWESSVQNVPQLHGAADPEQALVQILGMTPASASYVARNLLGPEYNLTAWRFLQRDLGQAWWSGLAAKSLAQVGDLSTAMATTRLANATFVNTHRLLTDVLVAPQPLEGQPAPDYVAHLQSLGWQALRDLPTPAQPVPLLLLLLRHAALRQYLDTAGDLLAKSGAAQPAERIEAELLGLSTAPRPTPWDLLQRPFADKGPVGAYLDGTKADSAVSAFAGFWAAFARLASLPAAALDAAARETMDLAAFRLDAWLTSMAHTRLDQMRAAAPTGGVVLGAFGWLEDLRPQAATPSAGYVHAPSLAQGATAAVLRSGYLSHQGVGRSPLQIDLTSDRVRLALHLLDGVREGQSLGALLGYRLERTLHDAGLEPLIAPLRRIAPLDNPDPPPGLQEAVAAHNVIDGLALLHKIFAGGTLAAGPGLPTDPGARARLTQALGVLNDALDAVADVTLAESVHQLTKGNLLRAGATLDAIARGDVRPPEIEVVDTPRAGTPLTYRLLTAAVADASPPGWRATPRARAEPRLNGWAAALLGDPTRVRGRVRFTGPDGAAVGVVEIGLDSLSLAPVDVLALADDDLAGELGARLLRSAGAARPSTAPADAALSLADGRDPSWPPETVSVAEFMDLAKAVAKLVTGARALTPLDLVAPGEPPGAIDTAELQARADAAEAQVRAALAGLRAAGAGDLALLAAAAFGAPGSIPATDPSGWAAQSVDAAAELAGRIAALDRLASRFVRPGAAGEARRDHDVARLKIVFGETFTVLPALDAATATRWDQLWSASSELQGADPLAGITWFQRMARVRPGAARLSEALLHAESLAGQSILQLEVAQLPAVAGERWVALPQPAPASGRLSLVAVSPQPGTAGAAAAGLLLDEWVEVIPSARQVTGLAFHHDEPTARAPQMLLLGVPADDFPEWTLEAVEGTVLEALDLAKVRAVDPDALNALGHYLPALYFAYNAGGPAVEAISTDFNLVRADLVRRA